MAVSYDYLISRGDLMILSSFRRIMEGPEEMGIEILDQEIQEGFLKEFEALVGSLDLNNHKK